MDFSSIATRVYQNDPNAIIDLRAYLVRELAQGTSPYALFLTYTQLLSVLTFHRSDIECNPHMQEWLRLLCMDIASFFDTKPQSYANLIVYKSVQHLYRLDHALRNKHQEDCKRISSDLFSDQKSQFQTQMLQQTWSLLNETSNRLDAIKDMHQYRPQYPMLTAPTPPPTPPTPPAPPLPMARPQLSMTTMAAPSDFSLKMGDLSLPALPTSDISKPMVLDDAMMLSDASFEMGVVDLNFEKL